MHHMRNLRMAVLESGRDYLTGSRQKSHGLNILIKSHLAPGLRRIVQPDDDGKLECIQRPQLVETY